MRLNNALAPSRYSTTVIEMKSYIEHYCGTWRGNTGNRIEISKVNDQELSATFYRANETNPLIRPWYNGKPSIDMIAILDFESQSELEIRLGGPADGFCLHLSLDFLDSDYKTATSGISRYEVDGHLDKYSHLFDPLGEYKKC